MRVAAWLPPVAVPTAPRADLRRRMLLAGLIAAVGFEIFKAVVAAEMQVGKGKVVTVGELVEIMRGGVQRCVAAAAVTVGQPLKTAASGRVTPMTIGTDPQDQYIGFALTAAAGAASVLDVQWVK